MSRPYLIHFADPMCSGERGFVPMVESIRPRFGGGLPIRLVMGGLRPGTTKPLDDAGRRTIREHWGHVREARGQVFGSRVLMNVAGVFGIETHCRSHRRRGTQVRLTT